VITDLDRQLFIRQLRQDLRDEHDIIHVNGYPEILRIKNEINTPMTIKLNGPPHSLFYDYFHPTKSSYSWLKQADAVISTGVTGEEIKRRTSIEPITINPGVDTTRFTPEGPEIENSGPTILWVGRFVPVKDLPTLIGAFSMVLNEFPNADLWLVGEGPLQTRIENQCKRQGVQSNVTFWGFVPNDELDQYYRAADVFVLSSKTENHPIALMEAMSCGRAVIAPDIGWIPKMVNDGADGLLIPPEDPRFLADAVVQCLNKKEAMGENARRTAVQDFSWGDKAEQMKSIFEKIIRK
jgi:glycosyltransferase involved in cell wall biosynthesis